MNYKQISKITIYSIFVFFIFIIGLTMFIIDFPNWGKYGWSYLSSDRVLPMSVQTSRAWCLSFLIFYCFLTILIIREIIKMKKTNYKKYFIWSLGIFTWLLIPYILYINIKEKSYILFYKYISQNRSGKEQICFISFKNGIKGVEKKDKLFWNTFFCYFVFLITFIDIIFVFSIQDLNLYNLKINNKTIIFDIFSYFTQLSNIACFLFMFCFVFFHNKIAFRNNTLMIAVSGYIFIVSTVFWSGIIAAGLWDKYNGVFGWLKTSWLHAVTPIFFITFFITSSFINKSAPKPFKSVFGITTIYPVIYAIYVYLLPLITRVSIYGSLTNLNPDMMMSNGEFGSLWNMFYIPFMILYFFIVILIFWLIPFYISKHNIKNKLSIL